MRSFFNKHLCSILLLSFCVLLGASCKGVIKSLSDLSALREELIREYKEKDINVVVQNSRVLGITFHNSSFNKLGEQDMGNKAREIALFAKEHYVSINSIDKIWVSFVVTDSYVVFHSSKGLGAFLFDKAKLAPVGPPVGSTQQGDVVALYNPSTNQTNVYLKTNLQLNDSRVNVTLLPHFIIEGGSVSAPKIVAPQAATLDFTSYSKRRMFPDDPQLHIYVDGQRVFAGKARLTNVMGSDAEKSFNEFLSQEISYSQFLQLTTGKRVRINLGSNKFELTSEQIKALQSMRTCVEELRC